MWPDQLWLFYSKGQHRQALEWLRAMALGKESSKHAAPRVYMVKSVEYLRMLRRNDSALVVEFSQWLLERDPALGLQVFMVKNQPHPPQQQQQQQQQQQVALDRRMRTSSNSDDTSETGSSSVDSAAASSSSSSQDIGAHVVPPSQVLQLLGVFDRSAKSSAMARHTRAPMVRISTSS
jgi:hypothetical protein